MNLITKIKELLQDAIKELYNLNLIEITGLDVSLNIDAQSTFGDISTNAAMLLAKQLKQNPRVLAQQIQAALLQIDQRADSIVENIDIAGPGFLNITVKAQAWHAIAIALFSENEHYFALRDDEKVLRYLIEFVSVNPTGPVHLGAGRNGIIGDVLAKILTFLGHSVHKEFYINDAGNQIGLLGESLQARCRSLLGQESAIPEGGYVGEYLIPVAQGCIKQYGDALLSKPAGFFANYAKDALLQEIKKTLEAYGVTFDSWFSEKTLHEKSEVDKVLEILKERHMAYEHDGALWFKSTEFGDDKDRVLRKSSGEVTYIAPDIAYHKNKFDRGFDRLIDILGQDHHGYVKRLQATMQALGYPAEHLDVILYQLVSIKKDEQLVKMSKRAGTFTKLQDILDTVGTDVARFFYLNRKAEAHLEFDIATALKKTDENPVFYLQYAYVRTLSLLAKACESEELKDYVTHLQENKLDQDVLQNFGKQEFEVLKKIISFDDLIRVIAQSYQTHLLSYYASELAHKFHNYYANNRIIQLDDIQGTKAKLLVTLLVKNMLHICLTLLGVSCPERM